MIELTDSDFTDMILPVNKIKYNSDVLKEYKILKDWKEFKLHTTLSKTKIIKYIACMYDVNSPFRKKIKDDVVKRKAEASSYAGLREDNGTISEEVRKIINNENKNVNEMIVAYARMHRNIKWSFIILQERIFYDQMLKIMNGDEPSKSIDLEKIQKSIEEATIELLNEDNNRNLVDDFMRIIEENRLDEIRPEGIAEKVKKGQVPVEMG